MRLVTCGDRTCHQPEIDHITTTYTTAEIVWDGGMTEYEIAVKPASEPVWPEPVRVNTTSYLLDSLMPATTYLYSIRQICDSVTYSDWLSGQFVTDTLPVGGFIGSYGWNVWTKIEAENCTADLDIRSTYVAGGFVGSSAPSSMKPSSTKP